MTQILTAKEFYIGMAMMGAKKIHCVPNILEDISAEKQTLEIVKIRDSLRQKRVLQCSFTQRETLAEQWQDIFGICAFCDRHLHYQSTRNGKTTTYVVYCLKDKKVQLFIDDNGEYNLKILEAEERLILQEEQISKNSNVKPLCIDTAVLEKYKKNRDDAYLSLINCNEDERKLLKGFLDETAELITVNMTYVTPQHPAMQFTVLRHNGIAARLNVEYTLTQEQLIVTPFSEGELQNYMDFEIGSFVS